MSGVCSRELFGVVGAGSLEEAGLAAGGQGGRHQAVMGHVGSLYFFCLLCMCLQFCKVEF